MSAGRGLHRRARTGLCSGPGSRNDAIVGVPEIWRVSEFHDWKGCSSRTWELSLRRAIPLARVEAEGCGLLGTDRP